MNREALLDKVAYRIKQFREAGLPIVAVYLTKLKHAIKMGEVSNKEAVELLSVIPSDIREDVAAYGEIEAFFDEEAPIVHQTWERKASDE